MLRLVAVSGLVLIVALAVPAAASDVLEAARSGDVALVRELIDADPELVNASTERGSTTLLFACVGGSPDVVRLLLDRGADARAANDAHYTPLHVAAARDHVEAMELLISAGADIESADLEGERALHHAAANGARRAVELLLRHGADLEARNDHGRTPLLLVARESGDIETARVLIRAGADINAVDESGAPSLGLAAWRGYRGFVDMLLGEGARMPESEPERLRLLELAAKRGLEGLVEALVEAGLDLEALSASRPELICDVAAGGSVPILERLVRSGFDVSAADGNGWTPLHCAAEFDRTPALEYLLAKGASLDARALAGENAYHVAVAEASDAAATLLAERGADTGPVSFPKLRGPYMGQAPPGDVPEPFAPGIVLGHYGLHSSVAFAPDGRSACWAVTIPPREAGYGSGRMLASRIEDGEWTYPSPPDHQGGDVPFFSPDGTRLYFISSEPLTEGGGRKENIWYVERTDDGWTDPAPLDPVVNAAPMHWQFSLDREGTLYMGSGDGRILVSRKVGGSYEPPADFREIYSDVQVEGGSPFISPDGDYLILSKENDLHVTFRRADETWTEPQNLGEEINTEGADNCPLVTPDGEYLIYRTTRNGVSGPHWVAFADRLERLRAEALGAGG